MAIQIIEAQPGYLLYLVQAANPRRVRESAVVAWAVDDLTYVIRPVVLEDTLPVTPAPGRFMGIGIPGDGIEFIRPAQSLPTGFVLRPSFAPLRTAGDLNGLVNAVQLIMSNLVRPSDLPT